MSNDDAKLRAMQFGRFDDNGEVINDKEPADDPLADEGIEYSLLNAGDIKKYVMATGLISPFFQGGASKSRMKDASYEGRIGDSAYLFDPNSSEPRRIFVKGDRFLHVPANSIVFVESDLYFRLPDFIALRFNLQIKHVHRGLLLGTGPLIDPGYWGKLCIPLHNLTDEPYDIPADEGLIWIEFTKTTSIKDRIGRPPLGKEFPDILPFLEKASRSLIRPEEKFGIRSSIPTAVEESGRRAEEAVQKADGVRRFVYGLGVAGFLAAAIAVITVFLTSVSVMRDYHQYVADGFRDVSTTISHLEAQLTEYGDLTNTMRQVDAQELTSALASQISELQASVAVLSEELEGEREIRLTLQRQLEEFMKGGENN